MIFSIGKTCRLFGGATKNSTKLKCFRQLYLAPPFLVYDYEPVALATQRKGLLKAKGDDNRAHSNRPSMAFCDNCGQTDRQTYQGWANPENTDNYQV